MSRMSRDLGITGCPTNFSGDLHRIVGATASATDYSIIYLASVLGSLALLSSKNLTVNNLRLPSPYEADNYSTHFTDEQINAQKGYMICLRP